MKKIRLYTRESNGVYSIMNEVNDEVLATSFNNIHAEAIRSLLESILNS